jgi:hypothetical protein
MFIFNVPRSFLLPGPRDALYYFLIGTMFNVLRFLLLGIVIGYLYKHCTGLAFPKSNIIITLSLISK